MTEVRHYFRNRSEDILTLDITHGDGWEPLRNFLGLSRRVVEFPKLNIKGNWLGRGW